MVFEYTDAIAERLPAVVQETLGCHVRSVERLLSGQVTYAFRVEADDGPMLVKVFRYAHVPRRATATFVEEALTRAGIRPAATRHLDAPDRTSPHASPVGDGVGTPAGPHVGFGEVACVANLVQGAIERIDIQYYDQDTLNLMIGRPVGLQTQGIPMALGVMHFEFDGAELV